MPDATSALRWYEANAQLVAERYDSFDPEIIHRWWRDQLPVSPAAILDIGVGTGRDAAWLAELGHDVIAVEPWRAMMQEGLRRRPNPRFRWVEDQLPDLDRVSRLGISFDLILLSAVWMFVPFVSSAFLSVLCVNQSCCPFPSTLLMLQFLPQATRAEAVSITSCTTEDSSGPEGVISQKVARDTKKKLNLDLAWA
jgi:SAM-dependent methyltransferase